MFKNYLRIAFRILVKRKIYSSINIFGLAIGIASFILIFLYVHNEITYDVFHQNADQIYKIYRIVKASGIGEVYSARTPDPLPKVLKNDYPYITNVARIFYRETWVTYGEKSFKQNVHFTDPSFFEVFTFPLLKGNPKTALENINSVVITEDFADKYFGSEDPMGKTLTVYNYDFIVTGVLRKIPANSTIRFNTLIPARLRTSIDPDFEKRWWSSGTHTYVQLSEAFSADELEKQFPYLIEKYFPDFLKDRMKFGLQPLTDIHLDSRMVDELVSSRSPVYLYILIVIAFAVLLIACINFMNLSTARYTERAKEIGMRKVLGAQRKDLIKQFLGESILLSFLSLVFGITLAELFLPEFNALMGKELLLDYTNNYINSLTLLGFGLFVGIFSGSYPALFLSAYKPVAVLKQQQKTYSGNIKFRRILVVTQFSISIALIICLVIIAKQLRYMKTKNPGFNPNNVLIISLRTYDMKDPMVKINAYLNAIHAQQASVGILSTTLSENVPGYYFQNKFGVVPEDWTDASSLEMIVTSIDEKFLGTYEMELVEGRNFSKAFSADPYGTVLLNETAANIIGWQSAVGKELKFVHEGPFEVIGVLKDIHFKSLQNEIEPLVYRYAADRYKIGFLSVRVLPGKTSNALKFLQEKWREIVSSEGMPFEYFFLAEKLNQSYEVEEKTARIIGLFSLLAVLLACLGLLGLTSLTVTQSTKEIGIRKVLGATVSNIVIMLSIQFAKLVLLANVIAWPIAYFFMNNWLQDYPYRINMGVRFYLLGTISTLLIALLAVGSQAIKAALANPVEALRYE